MSAPLPPSQSRKAWTEENSISLPPLPLKNRLNQKQIDKYREKIHSPENSLYEDPLPAKFLPRKQTAYKPLYLSDLPKQPNLKGKVVRLPKIKIKMNDNESKQENRELFSPSYDISRLKVYLMGLQEY